MLRHFVQLVICTVGNWFGHYLYCNKPVFPRCALISLEFSSLFSLLLYQKSLTWIINLLFDVLVFSITVQFYLFFEF